MVEEIEGLLDVNALTVWRLALAGIVLIATFFVARWLRRLVRSQLSAHAEVAPHIPGLVGRIIGWSVGLIGVVSALMIIGVQMGPVVLLLLIFAVMAAVSGRKVMENFAAGLAIQLTTPFVVGDRIETEDVVGWVEAITARAVVLTSQDRRTVYIPNSVVLDSILYNSTDDQQRRSEVGFAVAYGYDMPHVRKITEVAVAAIDLVHTEPGPVAYIDDLGDDGVNMQMRFYHDDTSRILARDQVAEAIMTALTTAGIDMPTPEIAIEQTNR